MKVISPKGSRVRSQARSNEEARFPVKADRRPCCIDARVAQVSVENRERFGKRALTV